MEEESEYTIYCSKCGNEMKNNSRYCMKCGNLNINHPDNKNFVKYVQNNNSDNSSDNNKYINYGNNSSVIITSMKRDIKSCFFFNIILYFIVLFIAFFIYYSSLGSINELLKSNVTYSIIVISFSFIYIFAYELLFIKLGFSWWKSLIPIYNMILLSKRVFNKKYIWLLIFVPFIGEVYLLVLLYRLGVKFRKSGFLTILFPMFMIPIISYGESLFEGTRALSEEDYAYCFKKKKFFLGMCFLFIIISIALFMYNNSVLDIVIDFLRNKFNEVKDIFG